MAAETSARTIETSFKEFAARDDIAVILISQQVANQIRHIIAAHNKVELHRDWVDDEQEAQPQYSQGAYAIHVHVWEEVAFY